MLHRSFRFLPHILVGLTATVGTPEVSYCADAAVSNEADAEESDSRAKAPSPGAIKFWEALALFESQRPEDIAAGRARLEAAANLEFPHAQFELGRYLLSGSYGFKKNARKGANQFVLAAERGNGFAMVAAGQCFYSGTGVSKNLEKAEKWLRASVDPSADFSPPEPPAEPLRETGRAPGAGKAPEVAGVMVVDPAANARANAHYLLGLLHQRKKEPAVAHEHFVAGGNNPRDGNIAAAKQAALNYAFGIGTERDPTKAREMLARSRTLATRVGVAVIQGWVHMKFLDEFATADIEERLSDAADELANDMMLEIAERFSNKKSKNYDAREAAGWYQVAADAGQPWAMMQLAFMYGGSELGSPDPETAFKWWERAGGGSPPGSVLAAANLAICYENGIGVAPDPAKAAEIHARHRQEFYLCHLGSRGAAPDTVQTLEQALKLMVTAARKGDSHAQYLMGIRYYDGDGVRPNFEKALEFFEKAARARHAGALRELGRIYADFAESDTTALRKAFDYYKQASDLGDALGAGHFAEMHRTGVGAPLRPDIAETYYLRAIELDPTFAAAYNNLSTIYDERLSGVRWNGGGSEAELEALVLKNVGEAASRGLAVAKFNLGRFHLKGDIVPKDIEKAYLLFDEAAADGLAVAHYELAMMHEKGIGVPVTYSEALYHYRLAALEGHQSSLDKLISSYTGGHGVEVDLDRAAFWLLKSIGTGDRIALITFADVQFKLGNDKLAFSLLESLEEDPSNLIAGAACERLSLCYEKGLGVKPSSARARRYYKLAIQKGNGDALARLAQNQLAENRIAEGIATMTRASESSANACYLLGEMYSTGTHVKQDHQKSLMLMRKASKESHSRAMYFLAAATFNMVPHSPAIEEAIRFAESAEKLGVPEAALLRQNLERRRDEAQSEIERDARARSG